MRRTKGKKPKPVEAAVTYKELVKPAKPALREIKGIFAAWRKATKFVMRLDAAPERKIFITKEGRLTEDKKSAIIYAHGYDDPEVKRKFWQDKLKLKLITENV